MNVTAAPHSAATMPRFDGGGIGDEKKLGFDRHAKEDALAVFEREMAEKKVTDRKVGARRARRTVARARALNKRGEVSRARFRFVSRRTS